MRGKGRHCQIKILCHGITPAYAGKSYQRLRHFPACRDHPRLCGEKSRNRHRNCAAAGSPPPMRGKASECFPVDKQNKDHPRLCGEKLKHVGKRPARTGSPPPMRGKGHRAGNLSRKRRITPAYAGKSVSWSWCYFLGWDHPRLCGEKD